MNTIIPNSIPREEFLIVLDYLFKFTCDEKHSTSQQKIIQYALDEYNIEIRRERIGQILDHLYELTLKYPEKFPFTMEINSLKVQCKYYVSKRYLDDDSIIKIVSAIQNDKSLSEESANSLTKEFLNSVANSLKQDKLKKKLETKRNINRVSTANEKLYDLLEKARSNDLCISFSLRNPMSVDSNDKQEYKKMITDNKIQTGFVYGFEDIGNYIKAVIYIKKNKLAIVTAFNNIVLQKDPFSMGNVNLKNYELASKEYKNVDSWLKAHYSGKDGKQIKVRFTFYTGNQNQTLELLKKKYKNHFKEEMKYSPISKDTGIRGQQMETIVDCNEESFAKWYKDFEVMRCVNIQEPEELNDKLLGPIMDGLFDRLKAHGIRYKNATIEFHNEQ